MFVEVNVFFIVIVDVELRYMSEVQTRY